MWSSWIVEHYCSWHYSSLFGKHMGTSTNGFDAIQFTIYKYFCAINRLEDNSTWALPCFQYIISKRLELDFCRNFRNSPLGAPLLFSFLRSNGSSSASLDSLKMLLSREDLQRRHNSLNQAKLDVNLQHHLRDNLRD